MPPLAKRPVQPTPVYITGVYCWLSIVDGKTYVGGAYTCFTTRKRGHLKLLRKGKHFNRHLQFAWNKYGEENFEWIVLETCPPDKVAERETWWIKDLKSTEAEEGYNLCPIGGSSLGIKISEEGRQRMSASRKGKKRGPYGKQTGGKKRGRKTGVPLSQETLDKITVAYEKRREDEVGHGNQGKKASVETRAKMSASQLGKTATPEACEKMKANHASKGPKAAERGAKISASLQGHVMTEETKRKISETKLAKRLPKLTGSYIPPVQRPLI